MLFRSMGMQEVQAGGNAGGFDLLQHLLQRFKALRVGFPDVLLVIVAAGIVHSAFEKGFVVQGHHRIAALFAVGDVLIHIFRAQAAGHIGGFANGAVAAALGVVSPCLVIITIIAACLANFQDNVYVRHALSAVSVCVCALIVDSIIAMWKKGVKDVFGIILFAIMLFAMTFTEASPVILVVLSAVAGVVVKSVKAASAGKKGGNDK